MILKIIIIYLYIFFSNEEIIKNGGYYIKFENQFLGYFRTNAYLSKHFKYPNTFFRINRQLFTLNETLYNISQISSEYQLCYLENNQLGFQRNQSNLQFWYLIKTKNNKYIIKNRNGCFIIIIN